MLFHILKLGGKIPNIFQDIVKYINLHNMLRYDLCVSTKIKEKNFNCVDLGNKI